MSRTIKRNALTVDISRIFITRDGKIIRCPNSPDDPHLTRKFPQPMTLQQTRGKPREW